MKPTAPIDARVTNPHPPPEAGANPRPELHALIETLPTALLIPLCDLLKRAHHELTLPGLALLVHTMHTLC